MHPLPVLRVLKLRQTGTRSAESCLLTESPVNSKHQSGCSQVNCDEGCNFKMDIEVLSASLCIRV